MADRQVRVRFVADTAKYRQDVQAAGKSTQTVGDQVGKTGGRFVGMGRQILGASAAAGAAGAVIMELANAASQLEQSIGATESVFGEAAGAVDEFASRSSTAVGLSEQEYRELAAVAGAQLKTLGFSLGEAAQTSNQLIEVGADLAATFGGTTRDAVDALGAAFRGEADPAERFGLRLNQAAVNAKAVELGLAESASAVSGNAKAQATLALIMDQSGDSAGQFAREVDTLAGAQQRANAEWEDSKAALGEKLLPVITDATNQMSRLVELTTDPSWGTLGETMEQGLRNVLAYQTFGLAPLAEGLAKAATGTKDLADMTDEEKQALIEASGAADKWTVKNGDIVRVTTAATDASRRHAEALGAAAEAADEQAEALENLQDEMRAAIDPLFAVLDADRTLAEAQAALTELQDGGEASLLDLGEAHQRVAEAAGDTEQAAIDLAAAVDNGTVSQETARATLQRWVTQGLITQGTADQMAAGFDRAGDRARALGAHDIVVQARADMSSFDAALARMQARANQGILVAVRPGQVIARQHGGPFGAREPVLVGEAGPELVAFDRPGHVIPNHRLVGAPQMAAVGTPTASLDTQTFNPSVSVTVNREADAPEIVREAMWQLKTMPR